MFCGACSIESKIAKSNLFSEIICNDKNKYLIAMWKALLDGWIPPDVVTKEEYQYIKNHKDVNLAMTGFIGFECSFSGIFFGGYARDAARRNYALQAKKSLLVDMIPFLGNKTTFLCRDYRDIKLPENCVVYCDPPYKNTKGYNNEIFDTDSFWKYMRKISKEHLVYISELEAPEDFVPIWTKQVTRTLDRNKDNQFKSVEKLFIHKEYTNG